MPMPRRRRIALAVAGLVIALPLSALLVLLNADWNRARPWLNARASAALGRPFAINGDLTLHWQAAPGGPEPGWRGAVPWPHLVARDVHIGNPAQMPDAPADMASAAELAFSINPFALLKRTISVPELRFQAPQVLLLRQADGSSNWRFPPHRATAWEIDLQRVAFSKGSVHLLDAPRRADVTADVDSLADDPVYGVAWTLRGSVGGERLSGSGKAGAVLSLQQQSAPYPLSAELQAGSSRIAVHGTLTRPSALAALDMRLKVSGPSMARLFPLTGIVLPETPPYSTEGHLSAALDGPATHWVYEQFTGRAGASDIGGRLDFQSGTRRPFLSGTVNSRQLHLRDLAPLIGADSNASKAARGATPVQPAARLLPVEAFKTERWTSVDADVRYSAGQILREQALPINRLNTHLTLKDGVLTLDPLTFDMAGGTLSSAIRLDASGGTTSGPMAARPDAARPIRGELKSSARHLKLKQLFPSLKPLQASAGEINGDASLSATGNSVASLLGSANGEIKTLINQGTISKLLLEEMGLNIGNVVLARLFGDRQVQLNCMVTDFAVTRGLMHARSFIVDTDDAILHVSGDIDLAGERIDLTLRPDSKGLRVFSLRSPLYVRGSFVKPDVSVDKGVLALRAGGALALAALAPVAALLPLISAGPGQASACAGLLARASAPPHAPPPGQTRAPRR